ncbi:MAG: hypothetical protein KF680_05980 [Cryobacterium sp.]|nr:hypothetical protein [Cryobacterium sp.]
MADTVNVERRGVPGSQREEQSMVSTPSPKLRLIVLGAMAAVIVTGGALAFVGLPIWLLVLGTGIALTGVLGQAMSWASATVSTLALLLIAIVVIMRILPLTGADIALTLIGSLAIVGLAAVTLLAARGTSIRQPSRASLLIGAHALPVPVLAGALAVVIALVSAGTRLSWGMNNDAATNTMLARYLWNNGGIDTELNPNASPLMQTLIVASSAPGRGTLDSGELLAHELQRNAQLWIVVVLLASLVGGLLVARAAHAQRTTVRICAAALGASVPLTWYVAGISFQFGFMNGPLVVALLGALWVVWSDALRAPLTSLGVLALLTTALLASWAPLAILPLALGAGVIVVQRTRLWTESTRLQRLWGIACGLQLLAYIGLVTLPDFLATSDGLGLDGGMASMTVMAIVVVCSVLLLVAVIGWVWQGRGHVLHGAVLLAAASTVAIGYLVYQRRTAESLWGYYPAKFAWFVSIMLVLVIVASVVSWTVTTTRRGSSLAMVAAAAVVALGLLAQVPPNGATLDVARAALDLRPGAPAGSVDEAVLDLIAISDPASRDLAVHLGPHDRFVNYWLIHMTAPDERDPIRLFGYVGDPNDLNQVCDAVETWGGGVTLHTRDPQLRDSLSAVCSADFDVSLMP